MKIEELFESASKKQTLYCSRKLLNGDDLVKWAKEQGFEQCLKPSDMHVTVAYSEKPVDMSDMTDSFDHVISKVNKKNPEKTKREIKLFGDDNSAVVLTFECEDLHSRWKELCKDFGASWDFPTYRPHVTISYDGLPEGLKLSDIEPYQGELRFGPETMAPIKKKWKANVKETPLDESELYFVQPDGKWKKNADGRSNGLTRAEVENIKGSISEVTIVARKPDFDPACKGILGESEVTETKPFREWFKDSKVVGSDGKPLIVYHGTSANFRAFNIKKSTMPIIWFTSDRAKIEAGEVGAQGHGRILDLYASVQNPAGWDAYDKLGLGELRSRGYDGAILMRRDGHFDGFVFEPTQLKSATKNRGNFDRHNKNLYEENPSDHR